MKRMKKQTKFSLKVVPVESDFTDAKDTAMLAMHISKTFGNINPIKNCQKLQQW